MTSLLLRALFFLSLSFSAAYAQNSAPVRLRVIVPLDASAPFDQALTEVVRQYNASKTDVKVELMRKGSSFQSLRTIIAAQYAGDLPDLALINEADLPTLVALKILAPVSEKWLAGKKFLPELSSKIKCGNETCSIPFQRRVPVWFFNRELMFKMNQDTEKIPTSLGALAALSLKLQKPSEVWGMTVPASGEAIIARWSALGLNPLKSPIDVTAEWVQKMWSVHASLLPGSPNADEASRRFMEQRAAILLGSLEQINYLSTNVSFKLGMTLPDGDVAWSGTDFIALKTPGRENTAAIHDFLDYLYRPDTALLLFQAASTLPVSKQYASHAGWKKELEKWPVLRAAAARKFKNMELERIPPQIREDWSATVWSAVERGAPADQRSEKISELRSSLQKILSTNPR